ncbi:MAG: hypothetical protein WBP27_06480 [Gemmiger qucibialis]
MLDKTSSIICAFGLAAAAPRSPYRHLELCGIALNRNHRLKTYRGDAGLLQRSAGGGMECPRF